MPKVISVHSFRGGTGKSNITANLATAIARSGMRVGIVDTDVQSPGIHVLFGMDAEKIGYTLNDYLWGCCTIEEATYDVSPILRTSLRSKQTTIADSSPMLRLRQKSNGIQGGIYLTPSSIKTNEISRILREGYDARLLSEGFRNLCRRLKLDYLFIDTHPGINEETLLSIVISHILVIVLRPDHQDYQGTAVAVDVARKLEVPKMLLVVNKVLPNYSASALQQQMHKAYDTTVAGILPVCEEMFQLGSSDLFCLRYPTHPWTQGIEAVSHHILCQE